MTRVVTSTSPWGLAWLAGIALLTVSCSVITDFSADEYLEQSAERCSDNVDNDGNGLADCADPTCRQFDFCSETTEESCSDGRDNDQDGRVDCKDAKCCAFSGCAVEPGCGEKTATACIDGIDNDNNGLTDCADFSCTAVQDCCLRLQPVVAESFDAASSGCQVVECPDQEACCSSGTYPWCNAFDTQRWVSWGEPRPRLSGGALSPNQPCPDCAASGVVSVVETSLSPNLHLEFEVDLNDGANALVGVGLVEAFIVPRVGPCGGVADVFPMLAGIEVVGSQVRAQIDGVTQAATAGKTTGKQRFWIDVDNDGALRFGLDQAEFYKSTVKLAAPYPRVRLLIQGRSPVARVDNVLLARRRGCLDLASWSAGPAGPGPAVSPGKSLKQDLPFDGTSLTTPSILYDGDEYRLYYTGRCTKDACAAKGPAIGLATSTDGQTWVRAESALTIHGETSTMVSAPAVSSFQGGYMMAYRALTASGVPIISVATSTDGRSWTRTTGAVIPGDAGDWDSGGLGGGTLVEFRNRLYLWYGGHHTGSTSPSIGLAISKTNKGPFIKQAGNPVLSHGDASHEERGVTDPAVYRSEDGLLHLWYVAIAWGNATSINYAASEDGRNWVRFPSNPLIRAGAPGIFGGSTVRTPTVLDRWGVLQLWYGGQDANGLPSIGHVVNGAL
jgi:Glycosyl hydrolases family 32 N-terminal domain